MRQREKYSDIFIHTLLKTCYKETVNTVNHSLQTVVTKCLMLYKSTEPKFQLIFLHKQQLNQD